MHRQRDNASSIPNDLQPPSWIQKLQMQQEQEERHSQLSAKHGVTASGLPPCASDQLPPASRPQPVAASELSFAALPKHGNILRQQLQRLKDEVALLQLMQAEAMKERDRISLESRHFRRIAEEQDEILQLFVQHHSSLLHASKHAPDCIGFKGAFETQRLHPQLHVAAARTTGEELDVDEHFDQNTESEDDDDFFDI